MKDSLQANHLSAFNPETLDLFVRTVQAGSFSAVAEQVGMATSSVSRQVMQLEQTFGGTLLFTRTNRGLTPTPAGLYLFKAAQAWLGKLGDIQRGMEEFQHEARGTLRIGCASPIGETVLLPLLPSFMRRHPNIVIDLRMHDGYLDVQAEDLDLFITLGMPPAQQLVARRLCGSHVGLYASPDYLKRHGAPQSHRDLAHHNCLVMQRGGIMENDWIFTTNGQTERVHAEGSFVCNTAHTLVQMIAEGVGIGMVMELVASPYLADGRLQEVLTYYEAVTLPHVASQEIYAVYPDKRSLSRKTRLFLDHLIECLAERAPATIEPIMPA